MQLPAVGLIHALLAASTVLAAVHRIAHDDAGIQYIPSTCDLDCTRVCRNQWWRSCLSDGTASHRTKGNNTSANYSFRGSSVTWYTRTTPDGGKAIVYIDAADPVSIDTSSPVVNEANAIFTKTGLDASRTHTISVVYDVGSFVSSTERFVDVRYFEYDDSGGSGSVPGNSAAITVSGSSSSSSSGTQSSSGASTGAGSSASGSHTSAISSTLSNGSLSHVGSSGVTSGSQTASIAGGFAPVGNASQGTGGTGGTGVPPSALIGFALGIILIGALIALGWFWRRRKRRAVFKSRPFSDSKEEIRRDPDLTVYQATTRDSTDDVAGTMQRQQQQQDYEMRIPEKLRRQHQANAPYYTDPFASTNSLGEPIGSATAGGSSPRRNLLHQDSTNNLNHNYGRGYDQRSASVVGSGTMNTLSSPTTDHAPSTPLHDQTLHDHDPFRSPNSYPESSWPLPEESATLTPGSGATADEKRGIAVMALPTPALVSPFESLETTGTIGTVAQSLERRHAVERSSLGTSYRTTTPPPQYVR